MKIKPMLSGNALKLIAAVTMLVDHAGLILFPQALWMRIIGRMAFPIYTYMIAEGCRYTRDPRRYFLSIFGLAVVCQLGYFLAMGDTDLSILVTFSLSILMIQALNWWRSKSEPLDKWLAGLAFCLSILGSWLLNQIFYIDYGFYGTLVPVIVSLGMGRDKTEPRWLPLLSLGVGLLLVCLEYGWIQWWCMASLLPLALYNGQRGRWRMKHFFYIYYPAHLVILEAIAWIRAGL